MFGQNSFFIPVQMIRGRMGALEGW